jgi:PIN domain nuclease of toxin-antitoxin system
MGGAREALADMEILEIKTAIAPAVIGLPHTSPRIRFIVGTSRTKTLARRDQARVIASYLHHDSN